MYHLIIDLVLLRFCIVDLYFWLVNLHYQTELKIGEKCTDSVLLDIINIGSENNRWFFIAWNFLKQLWNMFGQDHFYVVNKSSFNFKFYIYILTKKWNEWEWNSTIIKSIHVSIHGMKDFFVGKNHISQFMKREF